MRKTTGELLRLPLKESAVSLSESRIYIFGLGESGNDSTV
jgi:hypothetical protein